MHFQLELDSLGFVAEGYTDSLEFEKRKLEIEHALDDLGYWLRSDTAFWVSDTLVWQIRRGLRLKQEYSFDGLEPIGDPRKALGELEKSGFPFARFQPDSVWVEQGRVRVNGNSIPGPQISLDSIVQKGSYSIPKGWLVHYFGLKTGRSLPYAAIGELEIKALRSAYIGFERPAAVLYGQEKTSLYLYPRKMASNRLDALLGLSTRSDGAAVLSGQVDLKWVDLFHNGEEIRLFWEALPDQVQRLELKFSLPYLASTPLKLASELQFLRQDSSFANIRLKMALDYLLDDGSYLGLAYTVESSRVPRLESSITAYSKQLFGLRVGKERLDRRFGVASRGLFALEALAGSRQSSAGLEDQYRLQITLENQHRFKAVNALYTRLELASMPGAEPLPNEQFRIGGFGSLRGVPPLSVFASHFALGTLEFKRLLDRSTLVYALADGLISDEAKDRLSLRGAFGLGLSLRLESSELKIEAVVPALQAEGADLRATALNIRFETVF